MPHTESMSLFGNYIHSTKEVLFRFSSLLRTCPDRSILTMQLIKGTGKSDLSVPEQLISLSHNPVCRGEISAALFSDTKTPAQHSGRFCLKSVYSSAAAHSLSRSGMGRCWGQASSHWRHSTQSEAMPFPWVAKRYSPFALSSSISKSSWLLRTLKI